MVFYTGGEEPEKYSSYKKRTFEKKTQKMRALINSVAQSSLKDNDKAVLLDRMRQQISENL